MKTLVQLVILLAVVGLSVPAYGEILLYNLKDKELFDYEYEGGQWQNDIESERGYLLLDVDFATGEIVQAYSFWYWKEKNGKWYEGEPATSLELVVVDAKRKTWVILEKISNNPDSQAIVMMTGRAKNTDIGSGQKQDIAKSLKGYVLEDETDGADREVSMISLSLKLHTKGTKFFNDPDGPINQDFNLSELEVEDYLEDRGYELDT